MLADGIVLGLAAAVGGIVLGVAAATALRPLIEEYLVDARSGGWRFLPLAQLGIVVLAVGTGLLAAMVPAFTAARQSVTTVLAGRRGVVRSRKRWITLGLAMAAAGAVIAIVGALGSQVNVILGGLVIGELGLVLLTPSLVGLISRTGRWLPLAPRIALRDTARNRGAAAPAISAVMAAVAGAVAIGAFIGSEAQNAYDNYDPQLPLGHFAVGFPSEDGRRPDTAKVLAAIRETVPGADPHVFSHVACAGPAEPGERDCGAYPVLPGGALPRLGGSAAGRPHGARRERPALPRLQRQLGVLRRGGRRQRPERPQQRPARRAGEGAGRAGSRWHRRRRSALRRGRQGRGRARRRAARGRSVRPAHRASARRRAGRRRHGRLVRRLPGLVRAHGLAVRPGDVAASLDHVLTGSEAEQLTGRLRELSTQLSLTVERGPQFREEPIIWILGVIAALVALGAAGVATGLTAADSRPDLATLGAVGASPGCAGCCR
ncbi:hypothetical protein ACFQY4_39710 [Catellatospora bangladeshensis]|uniref:hypothetical protein n=1 Tax=Catellatospora bangladeshensis TaxID=310355 RepID=UPI003610E0CB